MDDYKPNSDKSKGLVRRESDVPDTAVPKVKKKSELLKLAAVFFRQDPDAVGDDLAQNILVPAVKKTLYDLITNAAAAFLQDGTPTKPFSSSSGKRQMDVPSYARHESTRSSGSARPAATEPRRNYADTMYYDDYIFSDRGEIDRVLFEMEEILENRRCVTVAKFYSIARIKSDNYADNYYGWEDISGYKIRPCREGWRLSMPRAIPIDDR